MLGTFNHSNQHSNQLANQPSNKAIMLGLCYDYANMIHGEEPGSTQWESKVLLYCCLYHASL